MSYDFGARRERALDLARPSTPPPPWSAGRQAVAYVRNRRELRVITLSDAGEPQRTW